MKILNMENGKPKMYVQLKDIGFLLHSNVKVPHTIYMAVLDDELPIYDHKSTDFYAYTDEKDIEFLDSLDFIVNYKDLRDLEPGELGMMMNDLNAEIQDVSNAYDTLTTEEKANNKSYFYRIEQLEYQKESIKEIMNAMVGNIRLDLPVVPDSDGFSLDSDSLYNVAQSLDHDKILLYRKDGEAIEPDAKLPLGLIQMGLSITIANQKDDGLEIGSIETAASYSKDRKYYITTFNVKKPVMEKKPVDVSLVGILKKVLGI